VPRIRPSSNAVVHEASKTSFSSFCAPRKLTLPLFRGAIPSGGAAVESFSGAEMHFAIHGVLYRLRVEKKYSLDRSVTGNTILISTLYQQPICPEASQSSFNSVPEAYGNPPFHDGRTPENRHNGSHRRLHRIHAHGFQSAGRLGIPSLG
jgi:hypothetical protein